MSGKQPGAPVGNTGLTPVGSPNRVQRRNGQNPGSQRFTSPPFPRTEENTPDPSKSNTHSTFAERVYQSTGKLRSNAGSESLLGSPLSPRRQGVDASFLLSPLTSDRAPSSGLADTSELDNGLSPASKLKRLSQGLNAQGTSTSLFGSPIQSPWSTPGHKRTQPSSTPTTSLRSGGAVASKENGNKQPGSAIPAAVVDLPSQRLYALAAFVLFTAWKLYDAIDLSIEPGSTSFYLLLKWCLLDAAIWYTCWRLDIPRMSINVHTMYILIALSVFINLNLFFLSSSIFMLAVKPLAINVASSCVRTIKQIPLLGPRLVGDSDLLIDSFELDDEHILGRHTIHVLPHSLAHMNPGSKSLCIDGKASHGEPWYWKYMSDILGPYREQQTTIPILINGTQPTSITYAYTSFETGQKHLRTIKNIGAMQMEISTVYPSLGNWVMATYYLPVREVGAYEIQSVKDAKGLAFRTATHAPQTVVVSCPRARLQWRADSSSADSFTVGSDGHASICQRVDRGEPNDAAAAGIRGSDGLIEAVVEGYEPIEMTIVRLVNGHREVIGLDGIRPRISEGPMPNAVEGSISKTQLAEIKKWARFRSRKSVYVINDTFLRAGEYVYKLESVRDAANHTVTLSESNSAGIFNGKNGEVGKATSYMARIQVHRRPSVGWSNGLLQGELPLRLSDDKQRNKRHNLPLRLNGQAPWTVEYLVINGDETTRESKKFLTMKDAFIAADRAGVYQLAAVYDKHCSGLIERTNITLMHTPNPTANVRSTPLTARECGGEIGAEVDLELSGRPPFAVHYRELNLRFPNSKPIVRVVRTQQRRHSFKIIPELAGTYRFEFFRLEDDNYPSGLPISTTIEQSVHAQPSAKLDTVGGYIPRRVCLGQDVKLPVRLKGQGPWELTYNIVHENRRISQTVKDIANESYDIGLGSFETPGEYTAEIVQVKDGNSCARDLLDVSTTITVREGGSQVGFQCPEGGVRVLDGEQARIPVRVSGEFPVEIKYHKVGDTTGHVYKAVITNGPRGAAKEDSVPAYGPGEYELVSTSDICAGTVDPLNVRCPVRVEPKPSAWFVTEGLNYKDGTGNVDGIWQLAAVCEGSTTPAVFELGLNGSGPWKIEYSVDYWSSSNSRSGIPGYADRSTTHTSVALQPSTLKTECCDPGLYRYTMRGVSDERYQRAQPLATIRKAIAPDAGVTVVEHSVSKSPLAELRAYLPDGTPLSASQSSSHSHGLFRHKPTSVKYCLAPGQTKAEGDAQTWAKVREHLPVFRVEFDKGGVPPFQAWIEVFPASGPSEVMQIRDIDGFSQEVVLPDSVASQIGRYHMRLVKTSDSRGCERQFVSASEVGLGRPDKSGKSIGGGIEIEYIEAPSARPASTSSAANPSRDVCVGDVLAFDLRGLNSWNVEYMYNGARRVTPAAKRLFRRIADVPGNFTLARVCHRSANDCCSEFDDLSYAVHDIPRVRVSGGKDVYQDILEGDTGSIRMDLTGTPPFTFTWQRRSLDHRGPDGKGKVLESHTVKDLNDYTYTINTASEGTFEVTFVQDRYCQYPKA
ncbi:hypothetical protein BX070DRAFT_138672 [Coemansia spiralis]|nr:hypothetical protein BX070DRAFT_138672 [Coemansia spiralis]